MNGTKLISWCKIIEIEENHMHSGINQRNFEKEILNLNCDKWTNVGESMWKGSRRLKWRLPLSAFHKAWLLTILSADLILFNLFVSLQPFTRPFLMEHQNEDFFFLSVSPPPISPSVASSPSCLYFFLSPSLSLCYQGIGVGVRVISVLHGNFRGTGGWYGLNRLSHSLFVWVSYQVQHVSSFFFAFPVNHSPVVLTEINQCI